MEAQLFILSDHYVHNSLAINPAFSGSHDALSLNVLYRNNWADFEGSPKTMSLSIHAPVFNDKVGLGFLILDDRIGVSKETNFIGSYAYRMNLGHGKLALGLGFGMTFQNTAWDKLNPLDPDDELLLNNSSKGVLADFSTGLLYSNKKLFIGLSLPLFLSHEYDQSRNKYVMKNNFEEYNYFANAGYFMDIDKNIRLAPSILIKYHQNKNSQLEMGSQVILKNKFSVGATYRTKSILVSMLQFQVNNQLQISYSFDCNMGPNAKYKYNSTEIMISYVFEYLVNVLKPRQF